SYNLSPGKLVYFKTATGFRSGGQNLRGGDAFNRDSEATIASFRDFAPEEVTEYEIGFKADWLDSRLRTNIAVFYDEYEDIQRSTMILAGGAPVSVVSNAASGTIQGIEAEITGVLAEGLQAGATFGWIDAKYDEYMDLDATGNPVDRSGEPFANTPKRSASLWSSYSFDLPLGTALLRADYSWKDHLYTYATADTTGSDTPAAGLLNARAQWDIDNLTVALWGKNI